MGVDNNTDCICDFNCVLLAWSLLLWHEHQRPKFGYKMVSNAIGDCTIHARHVYVIANIDLRAACNSSISDGFKNDGVLPNVGFHSCDILVLFLHFTS